MNYITMPAGKPILCEYPEYDYGRRYVTAEIGPYRETFEPRYERVPALDVIAASYLRSGAEARLWGVQARAGRRANEDRNDWTRFIRQPVISYSIDCKEVNPNMNQNIQDRLDTYMEILGEIRKKTDDERTAVSLLQEVSKDRRMEEMRQEKEAKNSVPATDRQKKFMKKLGIDFPETVTKQEASLLIDEELGRNGG